MGRPGLKILHVGCKNFPPSHGGVEKVVYDLVTGMPQAESHILTEWDSASPQPRVGTLERGVVRSVKQIRRYCRDHGIDVVHLHKESFAPHALLLSLMGQKCVLTVHGCGWRLARWPWHFRIAVFLMDCLACLCGPQVVFVGRRDWTLFRRIVLLRRIHLIQNGVNGQRHARPSSRTSMVYIGRLSPEKNIVNLITAAETAGVELDLYGPFDKHDPTFEDTVLNLLQTCTHVHWRGAVPHNHVRPTLAGYRVFVNPSFSEGLPVSVLEAAAEGLHLVLSDIPQHRLLGFPSCSYVDPDQLSFAEIPWDSLDGEKNYAHVRAAFGLDRMIAAYEDIYERIT